MSTEMHTECKCPSSQSVCVLLLQGRNDNQIKNRFNSSLRRKVDARASKALGSSKQPQAQRTASGPTLLAAGSTATASGAPGYDSAASDAAGSVAAPAQGARARPAPRKRKRAQWESSSEDEQDPQAPSSESDPEISDDEGANQQPSQQQHQQRRRQYHRGVPQAADASKLSLAEIVRSTAGQAKGTGPVHTQAQHRSTSAGSTRSAPHAGRGARGLPPRHVQPLASVYTDCEDGSECESEGSDAEWTGRVTQSSKRARRQPVQSRSRHSAPAAAYPQHTLEPHDSLAHMHAPDGPSVLQATSDAYHALPRHASARHASSACLRGAQLPAGCVQLKSPVYMPHSADGEAAGWQDMSTLR